MARDIGRAARNSPRVPGSQRQVGERPLSGVRTRIASGISEQSTLGGVGGIAREGRRRIGESANEAAQIFTKEHERANRLHIMEQSNRLSEKEAEIRSRGMAMRGKDALKASGLIDELDAFYEKEIEPNLFSDDQRDRVRANKEQRKLLLENAFSKHGQQQLFKYNIDVGSQRIADSIQSAQAAFISGDKHSADIMNLKMNEAAEVRAHLADLTGEPAEVTRAAIQKDRDAVHTFAINSMADSGDYDGASSYLKNARANGELQTADFSKLQGVIKRSKALRDTQDFADKIMKEGLSLSDALKKTRETFGGDAEVAALAEIRTRYKDKSDGERQAELNLYNQAAAIWEKSRGKHPARAVPPSVWNGLSPAHRKSLRREWEHVVDRNKKVSDSGKQTLADFQAKVLENRQGILEEFEAAGRDVRIMMAKHNVHPGMKDKFVRFMASTERLAKAQDRREGPSQKDIGMLVKHGISVMGYDRKKKSDAEAITDLTASITDLLEQEKPKTAVQAKDVVNRWLKTQELPDRRSRGQRLLSFLGFGGDDDKPREEKPQLPAAIPSTGLDVAGLNLSGDLSAEGPEERARRLVNEARSALSSGDKSRAASLIAEAKRVRSGGR